MKFSTFGSYPTPCHVKTCCFFGLLTYLEPKKMQFFHHSHWSHHLPPPTTATHHGGEWKWLVASVVVGCNLAVLGVSGGWQQWVVLVGSDGCWWQQ